MTLFSSYTLAFFRIIKSNEGHKRYLLIISHRREKLFVSHRGKCLIERNLKVAGGYLDSTMMFGNGCDGISFVIICAFLRNFVHSVQHKVLYNDNAQKSRH